MQCPRCSFENERTSTYCERCGALLQNVAQDEVVGQTEYKAPPPPPLNGHNPPPPPPAYDYTTPPPIAEEASSHPPTVEEWGSMSTPYYNNPSVQPTERIGVFSGILYFLGVLIIAFGAFAILVTFSTGATIGVIGLLLSLAIVIAGIVLFVRLLHHISHLRGWQRILWLAALTVAAFILLVISVIVSPSKTITSLVTSWVIFFYGLAWCIIALW
nr:hypothetical protein [Ktedonobacteraceae bacterium]